MHIHTCTCVDLARDPTYIGILITLYRIYYNQQRMYIFVPVVSLNYLLEWNANRSDSNDHYYSLIVPPKWIRQVGIV